MKVEILYETGRDKSNGTVRVRYRCQCGHEAETRKGRALKMTACPMCQSIKQNSYEIHGDIALIDVSTAKFPDAVARIDACDIDKVIDGKGRWFATNFGSGIVYACRSQKSIKMHRHILDADDGNVIDHFDGDGLNNTRRNIRETTQAENQCNKVISSRNKTGVNGVYRTKGGRFAAQGAKGKKRHHLGTFHDVSVAAAERHKFDRKYGFTERHGSER